jgi:hypothetical protein
MPSAALVPESALRFARMAESGIISMSPAPKVGVGILKMTFPRDISAAKSGCSSLHGPD